MFEADLSTLVSICPDPVIGIDRTGTITLFNQAAECLLGYRSSEICGTMPIVTLYHPADQARQIKKMLHAGAPGSRGKIEGHEAQILARDGRIVDIRLSAALILREGVEIGSIGFFHDLTERKRMEARLKKLSITDNLTGLYNQRHFNAVLEIELDRSRRYLRPLSLICIDLDHFKQVNDTLGHLEGDHAIRFAARAIHESIRRTDLAFRYGGDEFMVLLPETGLEEASVIANRVRSTFDLRWERIWMNQRQCPVRVSLSLGTVEWQSEESPDSLTRRADVLMYEAKRTGGNRNRA